MYRPNLVLVLAALVGILALFSKAGAHNTDVAHVDVSMTETGLEPHELTVPLGTVVRFENTDDEDHWPASDSYPTHQKYSEFDPRRPITPGESWEFTFEKTGQWTFHDHLNPHFIGLITVSDDVVEVVSAKKTILSKIVSFFRSLKQNVFPTPCTDQSFECVSENLGKITREHGPVRALERVDELKAEGPPSSIDDHQLAHVVGRETAKHFGLTSEAFLSCPMSAYNGGCQHGFFEYVLGKTDSNAEAADTICQSLGEEFSSKSKFYCYHGVGHGVMMAEAYDLQAALKTCDTFAESYAQEGCYQGVFMENVNGALTNTARQGIFSDTSPLEPCSSLAEEYRLQCFINHAGYLMNLFANDVSLATAACLRAPAPYTQTCLESIGLMTTNPTWQPNLLTNGLDSSTMTTESAGWQICQEFPLSSRRHCVKGGIDNIMNFNELDVTSGSKYCELVDETFQPLCYKSIGQNLRNQSNDTAVIRRECDLVDQAWRSVCYEGAGL